MDKSWSSSYQAYLGLAKTVGIDRVLFTSIRQYDKPLGNSLITIAIDADDNAHSPLGKRVEDRAHNAERVLGLSFEAEIRTASHFRQS